MRLIHIIDKNKEKEYEVSNIYIDDSIANIKYKIKKIIDESAELYLFICKQFIYSVEYYFNKSTNIFLRNTINVKDGKPLEDYNENLSDYLIQIPLGIENINSNYKHIINPFNVIITDMMPKYEIYNDNLLLLNFDGNCETIYVCDRNGVENYLKEVNKLNFINLYFPDYLNNKNFENENEIVDICYNLPKMTEINLKISKLEFEFKSKNIVNLQLINLFKNIHLNNTFLYSYHSKLFKLYSIGFNKKGEKVSCLKNNKVNFCNKMIKNNNSFCIYIKIDESFMFIELTQIGNMFIYFESINLINNSLINNIISVNINKFITIVNNLLYSKLALFDSLYSDLVIIKDIECECLLKSNDLFINKTIFYLKNNKQQTQYDLILKRVSDYNLSYEIQDYINKNNINNLMDDYSLDIGDANEYLNMNVIKNSRNDLTLKVDKMLNFLNIKIENIDNIYYLNTLLVYINTFLYNLQSEKIELRDLSDDSSDESSSGSDDSSSGSDDSSSGSDDDYLLYGDLLKKGGRNISYFQKRIEMRDPELLTKNINYSKKCALDIKRQPISLTEEEYNNNKTKIKNVLEYRNNYYVCPRYWSFKYGKIISESEFKSGKYGPLIDKIPENIEGLNYVYEFRNKNSEFKEQFPGFIEDHGKGLCLPCCFGKIQNEIKVLNMKKKCLNKNREKKNIDVKLPPVHISNELIIKQGNWGFLPKILQNYLNLTHKSDKIKVNTEYLLRYGVEESENQSFIACISTLLYYNTTKTKIPNITEMKKIIVKSITIDDYISYQNSNLITQFYNKNKTGYDIEKYKDSNVYKISNKSYFMKIVNSFENFLLYLQSDNEIDYTYLWDILSFPNKSLFKGGVNIVIFEIIENKNNMDRVNIVCPTNFFLNKTFDLKKESIMLIKHGKNNIYEPIYTYNKYKNGSIYTEGIFLIDLNKKHIYDDILLNIIKPIFNYKCKPINIEKIYKIPYKIDDIYKKINNNYDIKNYVYDDYNKLVGLILFDKLHDITGFIPCYPTTLPLDKEDLLININKVVWNNYNDTKLFLNVWFGSNAFYKVIENNIIIGFLTNTNQFIEIYPYIPDFKDEIKELNLNYNVNTINKYIGDNFGKLDNDRIIKVNKIKVESKLYNLFKLKIRNYLLDFNNYKLKTAINTVVDNKDMTYEIKIDKLVKILTPILKNKIIFVDVVDDFDSLLNNKTDKLIIPKYNLITNNDNNVEYYIKLADELIRFNKIRGNLLDLSYKPILSNSSSFILNDDEILLNIGDKYNINNDIVNVNNYIKNTTFDTANPDNDINKVFKIDFKNNNCNIIIDLFEPFIEIFPVNTKLMTYNTSVNCLYNFVESVCNCSVSSIYEIKKILIDEYSRLMSFDMFISLQNTINKRRNKINPLVIVDVESFIYNENYYISDFDIWILVCYFKIPSYLFSKQELFESHIKAKLLYKDEKSTTFLFIHVNHIDVIPEYSIFIKDAKGVNRFEISELDLSHKNLYTTEIKKSAKVGVYNISDYINIIEKLD
jgi:hypothetical protein